MSVDVAAREHLVLDRLKETYEHQGFQFFIEPLPEILPDFLRGFQPDAIALKPGDNQVIEVKFGRRQGEERRLQTVGRLVSGQPGWQLKVFYEGQRPEDELRFKLATRPQIDAQIAEAEQLHALGHHKAALLLGWSALEAIARVRLGEEGNASQRLFSPAQTVQALEMMGAIDRAIAQRLRVSAQWRNLAAQGELDATVDESSVADLLQILRALAAPATDGATSAI